MSSEGVRACIRDGVAAHSSWAFVVAGGVILWDLVSSPRWRHAVGVVENAEAFACLTIALGVASYLCHTDAHVAVRSLDGIVLGSVVLAAFLLARASIRRPRLILETTAFLATHTAYVALALYAHYETGPDSHYQWLIMVLILWVVLDVATNALLRDVGCAEAWALLGTSVLTAAARSAEPHASGAEAVLHAAFHLGAAGMVVLGWACVRGGTVAATPASEAGVKGPRALHL